MLSTENVENNPRENPHVSSGRSRTGQQRPLYYAAPYEDTTMHDGIYQYIRHPGALGEMPLYIALAIFLNNWFLVLWMTFFVLIYTPLAIYFEEMDLVKRFGDEYLKYKERTGALIPKIRKKNKQS